MTRARTTIRSVLFALLLVGLLPFGCASPPPANNAPATSAPPPADATAGTSGTVLETRRGTATFIAAELNGRKTAGGETFDGKKLVAAHASYPLGTIVRVTNEENARSVEVEIVDRTGRGAGRSLIDLSRAAAERLEFIESGRTRVRIEVLRWGATPPKR